MIRGIAFWSFVFVLKGEKGLRLSLFLSEFVFFLRERKKEKKWVNSSAGPWLWYYKIIARGCFDIRHFCLRPTIQTITCIFWERLSVRYCGQTKTSVVSPPVSHFSNVLGEVLVELTTVIKLEFLIIRDKGALGSLVN